MSDKKNILIVDDQEIIRDFLYEVLIEDYEVNAVTDGDEAIDELSQKKYDLIITDLKMERVQGEEVVKFVHETEPDSKVIVISGYSSLYSVSQSVNNGAFAFLSKPFSIKKLLSTVTAAIG